MAGDFEDTKSGVRAWLSKRELTFNLSLFLVLWYTLQLFVLDRYGWDTASWLFYFEPGGFWPGFSVGPGLIFSSISHDMADVTHLGSNLVGLLFVGSFAEPYLKRRTYVAVLVGVGFLGILFSNVLAVTFETQWVLAGASAGLLSLHAYTALRKREFVHSPDPVLSKAQAERLMVIFGLLTIPIIPVYEVAVGGNIGHALGPVLGAAAYYLGRSTRTP